MKTEPRFQGSEKLVIKDFRNQYYVCTIQQSGEEEKMKLLKVHCVSKNFSKRATLPETIKMDTSCATVV